MTENDLYEAWQRWLHRNDMAGDLDEIYTLSEARIVGRVMGPPPDLADILANHAELYLTAGLCELHALAQDDENLAVAERRFEDAFRRYAMRKSLDDRPAVPMAYQYLEEANGT